MSSSSDSASPGPAQHPALGALISLGAMGLFAIQDAVIK